ncbi:MAG TPA: hypothetical protein VER96_07485 [Polyangiaceae bacterium]|nr:hypothetical protein [Polyangiaceae bacterium]
MLFGLFAVRNASAAGVLGPNGSEIKTSSYALDLFHGPVFAGTRVTGLGGAYVAIAEDVDGDLQNPAAPAVRPFFSYSQFDYWLGFGITFPATLSGVDFFNSGNKTNLTNTPEQFVFFTPAVNLQWGEFGLGLTLEMQQYELSGPPPGGSIRVQIPTTHVQLARGIDHNQMVIGVGARSVSMSVVGPDAGSAFSSAGFGLEFGAVYKPENLPLRLGLAVRTPVETRASYRDGTLPDANGDLVVQTQAGLAYLPKIVAVPWDFNFGFAVQLGNRPLNPPWRLLSELTERQTLQHRLRELDRDDEMQGALRLARSESERERIEQTFAAEQAADDRRFADEQLSARREIERQHLAMNRFYLQFSGSMLVSGSVDAAVGIESLLTQKVNRSGQSVVSSPRVGAECGIVPEWVKLRAGSYLEPTRFETSDMRVHGTAGIDIKLFRWSVFGAWPDDYMWRLGLAGDASTRYYTFGLSLGGWYPRKSGQPEPMKMDAPQLP